jgi:hypothetical protein
LELLTGNKNYENWKENKKTAKHPWRASPKARRRSLVHPQKMMRKGDNVVCRSPHSINYENDRICELQGRFTNTNYYNTPKQHKLNDVTDT